MQTFNHYRDVADLGHTVTAIGNFDGVHLGHQALLRLAKERADDLGVHTVVLTFDPHPMQIVAPERRLEPLSSLQDRLALLDHHGVDAVLAQRFDREFSSLSPEEFVQEILVCSLQIRAVIVGYNFGFGAQRAGTVDLLRALGRQAQFDVHVVDSVTGSASTSISSSAVRRAVHAGNLDGAAEQLGRPHFLTGRVVKGAQRGREIGFPTANIEPETRALPPDGVYAGWFDDGLNLHRAVANLGRNPTFGSRHVSTLEIHALNTDLPVLYGHRVRFYFESHLRREIRFDSVEALIAQIGGDCEVASRLLAARTQPPRYAL